MLVCLNPSSVRIVSLLTTINKCPIAITALLFVILIMTHVEQLSAAGARVLLMITTSILQLTLLRTANYYSLILILYEVGASINVSN